MLLAAAAVALAAVSGGSSADPRTPAALPGLPPPFLGTAVAGGGGLTAAVDSYGDVVDLRAPGPAGRALIDNPAARQAAGTVAADTGIVPRVRTGGGPALPFWRADSVSQRYLEGTSVVRTAAWFGRTRVVALVAAAGRRLAMTVRVRGGGGERGSERGRAPADPQFQRRRAPRIAVDVDTDGAACRSAIDGGTLGLICMRSAVPLSPRFLASQPPGIALAYRPGEDPFVVATQAILARAAASNRAWLARARPLGAGAPAWARALYRRSLLVLRALTDRRSGAVAAGARDDWAYVWPRDAGAAALAFAAAGYRREARHVARFLLGLDLGAAARFEGGGAPVPRRAAQGDAGGWVGVAAKAAGLPAPAPLPWRDRADYQEGEAGDYLANALAAATAAERSADAPGAPAAERSADAPGAPMHRQRPGHGERPGRLRAFFTPRGLVRGAADPSSGLDSAAAWAVRPFPQPPLFPAARRTLLRLAGDGTRFGIVPGESWPGTDPWTAPTAWSAWALAALSRHAPRAGIASPAGADRRAALRLLGDLRRAATPAGDLPERVDAHTGVPRSTTPLAWPHAFAVLALRQLWPSRAPASG